MRNYGVLMVGSLSLAGCFNLATPPAQITGSYTSGLKYEQFTCEQLAAEIDSLIRREGQLVIAQEQRRQSSMAQAFWLGFGQGDGIEASELANVRGEKEAVRKAVAVKPCEGITITDPVPPKPLSRAEQRKRNQEKVREYCEKHTC